MAENKETKTKITDLNTECFIEICRYLNRNDLYNLKVAHDAFGHAVDYIVHTTDFEFVITNGTGETSEDGKLFEDFVELFGRDMKCLNIKFNGKWKISMSRRLEHLIGNYCASGNIKHCKLDGFDLRKSFLKRNILFFNSLSSLKLLRWTKSRDIPWLMEFIAISGNIKDFYLSCDKLECNVRCNMFHKIASSKLEICCLNFDPISDLTKETSDLPTNYTLRELDTVWSCYDPVLLTYFPNIESLKIFRHSKYSLDPILTLPALRTFEFKCYKLDTEALSFLTQLADQNNLESFALGQFFTQPWNKIGIEVKLTYLLCQMTNLRKLKLKTEFQFADHLSRIGGRLKNLQEFTFYCFSVYGSDERKKISQNLLEIVKMAKKLTAIECTFFGELDANELCETLMNIRKAQENTEILYIGGISPSNWPILSDEQRKYIKFVEMKY